MSMSKFLCSLPILAVAFVVLLFVVAPASAQCVDCFGGSSVLVAPLNCVDCAPVGQASFETVTVGAPVVVSESVTYSSANCGSTANCGSMRQRRFEPMKRVRNATRTFFQRVGRRLTSRRNC